MGDIAHNPPERNLMRLIRHLAAALAVSAIVGLWLGAAAQAEPAADVPTVEQVADNDGTNSVAYWCPDGGIKYEPVSDPFIVPPPPWGAEWEWTLLVLKAGSGPDENYQIPFPVVGQGYSHPSDHENSHAILCKRRIPTQTTTTEATTSTTTTTTPTATSVVTTVPASTTSTSTSTTPPTTSTSSTTEPASTTTVVEPTTTTTEPAATTSSSVEPTTTTSVPDSTTSTVMPTTSSSLPASSSTTPGTQPTTSVTPSSSTSSTSMPPAPSTSTPSPTTTTPTTGPSTSVSPPSDTELPETGADPFVVFAWAVTLLVAGGIVVTVFVSRPNRDGTR